MGSVLKFVLSKAKSERRSVFLVTRQSKRETIRALLARIVYFLVILPLSDPEALER